MWLLIMNRKTSVRSSCLVFMSLPTPNPAVFEDDKLSTRPHTPRTAPREMLRMDERGKKQRVSAGRLDDEGLSMGSAKRYLDLDFRPKQHDAHSTSYEALNDGKKAPFTPCKSPAMSRLFRTPGGFITPSAHIIAEAPSASSSIPDFSGESSAISALSAQYSMPRLPSQEAASDDTLHASLPTSPIYARDGRNRADSLLSWFDKEFLNLGIIGRGSFSEVFQVVQREKVVVALKEALRSEEKPEITAGWLMDKVLPHIEIYAVKRAIRQFRSMASRQLALKEVEIIDALTREACPNIVQYVRAWEEKGYLYLQTQWYPHGSLKRYQEDTICGPLSMEQCVLVLHHVSSGLQVIHGLGMLHLDIKPGNLFLTADGVVAIGDFGLCVKQSDWNQGMEGDSRYLAAEVLTGDARCISPAVDIFSLGISMLELLLDVELPTSGPCWHKLRDGTVMRMMDVVHEMFGESETSLPSEVVSSLSLMPKDLEDLLIAMLHPDPDSRPTTADILKVTTPLVDALAAESSASLFRGTANESASNALILSVDEEAMQRLAAECDRMTERIVQGNSSIPGITVSMNSSNDSMREAFEDAPDAVLGIENISMDSACSSIESTTRELFFGDDEDPAPPARIDDVTSRDLFSAFDDVGS